MLHNFISLLSPANILVLLLIITVLVAAHEYGHYLFARLFGMGVEEFAIGFGRKPIWTYRRKKYLLPLQPGDVVKTHLESPGMNYEVSSMDRKTIDPNIVETPNGQALQETTNFTVRPWPLGGFVRIKGMLPEEDGSETKIPGGFYSKPPWQRFIVLLAGPVFSVLAGVILVIPLLWAQGEAKANLEPVLGQVNMDQPAYNAGLRENDRIISVEGKPIANFYDMVQMVRHNGGKQLTFVYERGGQRFTTHVTPRPEEEPSPVIGPDLEPTGRFEVQAKISAAPQTTIVPLSIGQATLRAAEMPGKIVGMLASLFRQPAMLKKAVGGPITMLDATQKAVSGGIADVIATAAMLSISVGIFNLLPVPPLDGGQMAIAVAEMFRRGRRLSIGVQNMVAAAGMMLVLTLVVTVFFIDFQRLGAPKPPEFKPAPVPEAPPPK